jgi:FkbM family methyltransferase
MVDGPGYPGKTPGVCAIRRSNVSRRHMTEQGPFAKRSGVRRVAQWALPYIAKAFENRFAMRALRFSELGSCLIQGKGSGSGWDLGSEIVVAAKFIKTEIPVLMDVGANWGEWSRGMLRVFPRCSRLLIVEPQSKCLEGIAKIDFPGKEVFACAVADQPGELNFYTAEEAETWACASFFPREETYFAGIKQRKVVVPVRTLDEILSDAGVQRVDFMKMDLEGAELLALKGAEVCLRSGKIAALSFEFGSGNINSRTFFRDFWGFLREFGFSLFRVTPGGGVLEIEYYYEDLEYFRGVSNYVAARELH